MQFVYDNSEPLECFENPELRRRIGVYADEPFEHRGTGRQAVDCFMEMPTVGRTRVEGFATIGMIILVIALVLVLWSSWAGVNAADLCAAVRSGSLLQTGEDPVTFDIVVNHEIVLRSVTAERIMNECQ